MSSMAVMNSYHHSDRFLHVFYSGYRFLPSSTAVLEIDSSISSIAAITTDFHMSSIIVILINPYRLLHLARRYRVNTCTGWPVDSIL